ncbi:MAG: hypothetical protein QW223_09850 [Candidatus Caldarchaeum sp.]
MAVTRLFGASVKRREDPRFLTGRGRFTANLKLPSIVYAVLSAVFMPTHE